MHRLCDDAFLLHTKYTTLLCLAQESTHTHQIEASRMYVHEHRIQRFWLIEYLTLIFLLCVEKLKFYSFKHLHSVFYAATEKYNRCHCWGWRRSFFSPSAMCVGALFPQKLSVIRFEVCVSGTVFSLSFYRVNLFATYQTTDALNSSNQQLLFNVSNLRWLSTLHNIHKWLERERGRNVALKLANFLVIQ